MSLVNFDFDQVPTVQECGRPTLKGKPCTRNAEMFVPGCGVHASEDEIKFGRQVLRAWQGGYRVGSRQKTEHLFERITSLSNEIKILKTSSDLRVDDGGDQIVEVDGFAFRWSGSPRLALGEMILLAACRHSRRLGYANDWPGKVTALGTRYTGLIQHEVVSRRRYGV